MNFIRVETFSKDENKTLGGYIGAAYAILAIKLDMLPTDSAQELANQLSRTNDPAALNLWCTIAELSQMQQPEIYVNDKNDYICLYTENKFKEDIPLLTGLDEHLNEVTDGMLRLVYTNFEIENDEILYDDEEQIVISRDTYESRKRNLKYNSIRNAA